MVDIRVWTTATIPSGESINLTIYEDRFGVVNSESLSIADGTNSYTLTSTSFQGGGEFWIEAELSGGTTELDSVELDYLSDEVYIAEEGDGIESFGKGLHLSESATGSDEVKGFENNPDVEMEVTANIPKYTAINLTVKNTTSTLTIPLADGTHKYNLRHDFSNSGDYWLEAELFTEEDGTTPELDYVSIYTLIKDRVILIQETATGGESLTVDYPPVIASDSGTGREELTAYETGPVRVNTVCTIPLYAGIDITIYSIENQHTITLADGEQDYYLPQSFNTKEQIQGDFWVGAKLIEDGDKPELDKVFIESELKYVDDDSVGSDKISYRGIGVLDTATGDDSIWKLINIYLKEQLNFGEDERVHGPIPVELSDTFGFADNIIIPDFVKTTISDSFGFSDSIIIPSKVTRTVTDSLDFSTSLDLLTAIIRQLSDSVGVSDTVDAKEMATRVLIEDLQLSDSVVKSHVLIPVDEKDSLELSETDRVEEATRVEESDDLSISETEDVREAVTREIAESLDLSEVEDVSELITVKQTDTAGFSDDVYANVEKKVTDSLGFTDAVGTPIERELYDSLGLSDSITVSEEYECVIDGGGTYYLSDLTPMACVKVTIKNGSTLIIDEPWRKQIIQVGDNFEKGHVRFEGDFTYDVPAIDFRGPYFRGFIFVAGSIGNPSDDSEWIVSGNFSVRVDDSFSMDNFTFYNVEDKFKDVHNSISFAEDETSSSQLWWHTMPMEYNWMEAGEEEQTGVKIEGVEGGKRVWTNVKKFRGDSLEFSGMLNRFVTGGNTIDRLYRLQKDWQYNAPVLVCSENFFGYAYISSITDEVEKNGKVVSYDMELEVVDK